jgi:fatty-acyl-CoA synthase
LASEKPGTQKETRPEDLKTFLATFAEDGVIPKYGVPDRVQLVAAIAKTSVGKIDKKQLRKDYR